MERQTTGEATLLTHIAKNKPRPMTARVTIGGFRPTRDKIKYAKLQQSKNTTSC